MSHLILGTAGHIDHGKTELVKALTGVETGRLREEKARGITIELGFAELAREGRPRFGVVDVPGHEAFVRAMVAGAAGMHVVLLVVAADEGVMPQTREHLAIVELLGVPELVVALTKADAVDEEWLELVDAEVEELLDGTPYRGAPRVATSATAGTGLDHLLDALETAAGRVRITGQEDLARLPLDRVFTIQGTGTVVTGTLWSGALRSGERVRVLPQDLEARIRGIQVHERSVGEAVAGDRTAVALSGAGADRGQVARGSTLVTSPAWSATWMLTARVQLLPDTAWSLGHNQRVHVHHGTAEVLARCALLEDTELLPGDSGWIQARLEQPLAVRARDQFVIRAYSPVTTIGGGVIAESSPPKRNRLDAATRGALAAVLDGEPADAIRAHLELSAWGGADVSALPVRVGLAPDAVEAGLTSLGESAALRTSRRIFHPGIWGESERRILARVESGHRSDPLSPAVSLASVRSALPAWAPADLADAVVTRMVGEGRIESAEGGVRLPGHRPEPTPQQQEAVARLGELYGEAGLAAPAIEELPADLRERKDLWSLIRRLEAEGAITQVADGHYVRSEVLDAAGVRIAELLAGRTGLGPADFREALPVTRKHLIPLLNYFDGKGVTIRRGEGREVPPTS